MDPKQMAHALMSDAVLQKANHVWCYSSKMVYTCRINPQHSAVARKCDCSKKQGDEVHLVAGGRFDTYRLAEVHNFFLKSEARPHCQKYSTASYCKLLLACRQACPNECWDRPGNEAKSITRLHVVSCRLFDRAHCMTLAISSALLGAYMLLNQFYDMTTIAYNNLEHTCFKQYINT